MRDLAAFLDDIRQERDALEAEFETRVKTVVSGGSQLERSAVIEACWNKANEVENRWFARLKETNPIGDTPYRAAWSKMSEIAGMPGEQMSTTEASNQ